MSVSYLSFAAEFKFRGNRRQTLSKNYRVVEVQANVDVIRRNVGMCEQDGHNPIRKRSVLEL